MENDHTNQNKHKHKWVSSNQEEFNAILSQASRRQKKQPVLHRLTSLTENEKYALTALLIDPNQTPTTTLTKEVLLTTPFPIPSTCNEEGSSGTSDQQLKPTIFRNRNSKNCDKLWRAHELGILHKVLRTGSSLFQKNGSHRRTKCDDVPKVSAEPDIFAIADGGVSDSKSSPGSKTQTNVSIVSSESQIRTESSIRTDVSQCKAKTESDDNSVSSTSSWGDNPVDHYDSWKLLQDEYANDYGFGYKPDVENLDEGCSRTFEILGTSADDLSAQPHVLSPPMMESLLSFVPESLSCENWWLKYSLVRDGASLETFQNYTKAAVNTVIAIQTTSGYVFGCFTRSPWRINHGYFGSGEAFVWKMRYNRFLKCVSLYDQGTMESIIDVYPFSGLNKSVQLLHHDFLAVGGGEVECTITDNDDDVLKYVRTSCQNHEHGFAIALDGDLQRGTSSPSSTFCNPKLTGEEGGVFEISNLEVWTLTPCSTVQEAEQLEMTKHFLHEKLHSHVSMPRSAESTESPTSPMSSQRAFYHRLGEDGAEQLQDLWNLSSAKSEPVLNSLTGKSPRFVT
mmetsp:Transcript_2009/g.3649  ORF Transcript_2009/g.3649 Transcript_2009/m.3649 type:complete len:566 (+) Transcript_2009:104-1801(+)